MLRNILVYWFLVEVLAVSLASSDDSKVLMLDTRNLQGADKDWGNGLDYSVTLAKESNRAKAIPRTVLSCRSSFKES